MAKKKVNINSRVVGEALGSKVKNLLQNGNDPREIPKVILNTLTESGLELPDKVKQAIAEYQLTR